jgi:hypothetical protein
MPDASTERERYAQYPNTVLEFETPHGLRIDLRQPLDGAAREALDALSLGSFGVFTAENPAGEHVEDEDDAASERARERANDRRMRVLIERLADEGVAFVRVDGVAPDGNYREHCVALAVELDDAVALAAQYEQLALFWYDGEAFWLLPAEAEQEPKRLPAG